MTLRRRLRVLLNADIGLGVLLAISAFLRLFRLGLPNGALIGDEAYYVQAARVILGLPVEFHHLPADAQSGLDPNAEHPPLAKLIIAASIRLFGDHGLAWRLPSAVLATASIWLVYKIVRRLGGSKPQALVAAFVMSFDHLAFIQGRIAMLDVYMLAFGLAGVWLYLEGWAAVAGILFGLSILCKINGIFFLVAMPLFELGLALKERHVPPASVFERLSIMTAICGAFTLFALGALDCCFTRFRNPLDHLTYIFDYGTHLKRLGGAAGSESEPFRWWFNETPMDWLKVSVGDRTHVLFRANMTGYVVFAAPFALGYAAWKAWHGSRLCAMAVALLIAGYLPVLLAWALASRVSYIFYFLPTIPAIALAIGSCSSEVPRALRWSYMLAVLVSFADAFPFRR